MDGNNPSRTWRPCELVLRRGRYRLSTAAHEGNIVDHFSEMRPQSVISIRGRTSGIRPAAGIAAA
jgi:hypothetical protein